MRAIVRRCLARHTGLAAYLALFLALGGTAYAAATVTGENIVDGSVKSADIGDGEVNYADIAMNGVHSSKVFDDSLQSQDIRDETLESRDIKSGAVGSAEIATGAVRRSELELGHHIVTAETNVSEKSWRELTASCPVGETAISAGLDVKGVGNDEPVIRELYPISSNTWFGLMSTMLDDYDASWGFRMKLTCVSI
jgi:hypothetical protein